MGNPVVHFEIGCRDIAKTAAFYKQAFGWSLSGEGASRRIDTGAGEGVNGHLTALGHEPHAYVNVYVEVDDVADGVERVKAAGGEAMIGPLPTPDDRTFAWVQDPAGNTIGLIGPGQG